jgi:hypothetical protein
MRVPTTTKGKVRRAHFAKDEAQRGCGGWNVEVPVRSGGARQQCAARSVLRRPIAPMKSPHTTTTLDLHRATPWLWLYSKKCRHSAPIACAVPPSSGGGRTPRAISFGDALGARPADTRAPRYSIQAGVVRYLAFCRFPWASSVPGAMNAKSKRPKPLGRS